MFHTRITTTKNFLKIQMPPQADNFLIFAVLYLLCVVIKTLSITQFGAFGL